jgi:hypothetical protein
LNTCFLTWMAQITNLTMVVRHERQVKGPNLIPDATLIK